LPQPPNRVLCVEDNEDICFMLTMILGRAGYNVSAAANPAEALRAVGREHFDLFILDTWFGGRAALNSAALSGPRTPTPPSSSTRRRPTTPTGKRRCGQGRLLT